VTPYKWPALGWGSLCALFIMIITPIAAMEEYSHSTSIDCGICLKSAVHIVGDWGVKSNLFLAFL